MKKTTLSAFVAAVALCGSHQVSAADMPVVYDPDAQMLLSVSDNGLYAISSTAGDDEAANPGVLVDISARTTRVISPREEAVLNDVADNGIVVGSYHGLPGYWNPATDSWTTFDAPAPWGGGCFMSVTPDARYAVGYYSTPLSYYDVTPMYIDLTTGESKPLPNLPRIDQTGVDQNENLFYGISPDGRYVLGQMSQAYLTPVSMISYIYDTEEHTWRPIGFDFNEATRRYTPRNPNLSFINSQAFSPDGAWVGGSAYMVYDGGQLEGGSEGTYPYRYNVATDEFEVFTAAGDENVAGNRITNDGVVLGASPAGYVYPTAQVRCGKYFVSLDQIFEQVYGTTVERLVHQAVTGAFQSVSSDGLTAVLATNSYSYILMMPESFEEAASKVDLLSIYTPSIPAGSAISSIGEINLTFDRKIEVRNRPQDVKLLDKDGNQVRAALTFAVSNSNPNRVVITFRTTTLTPGEEYSVVIPAGMIWLSEDSSVKSKEITLKYVGRANQPVKALRISPSDGSAVARFNAYPDYITVTFDNRVKISDQGSCILYNTDDNSIVAHFAASADGYQAIFFPTSEYNLYRGSNYKVVIGAGTVTDLSGNGGNEEITIDYVGAYERQLSSDDVFIFHSKCDDYSNFIFWQSEFNKPSTVPTSWGFTAETPWLLLRDNENSSDWALCAHSMFTPPGESDDWLIVPQLHIPDANTVLSFDAQSYHALTDDVLKVYVYEDNAVYNYFTMELEETFKKDGQLVFDEIIPAGATDEGLDGEWTHYSVDLSAYAGKNIYIAFVNNNYDKSAIFLDNIAVARQLSFVLTNMTPGIVVDADEVEVRGMVAVPSETDVYHGIKLTLNDADGHTVAIVEDPDATLSHGDSFDFHFGTPLPLTVGKENAYTISLVSGEENLTYDFKVADLVFQPVKKVVLEEYTGAGCGNCPLGIRAIENLQGMYADNFIPVTLRAYEDPLYSAPAVNYASFLHLNAAPSGRINRGDILSPMLQNGSQGYTFFGRGIIMSDGEEAYLWADAVQDEMASPALAEVAFSVTYDAATGALEVPVDIRFAIDRKEASIGVFAVVLEDNLPTIQTNYFNTVNDPILGEWGVGGMYAQPRVTTWRADDVTRFVVNGSAFNGTPIGQSDFVAGEVSSITLRATLPDKTISNPANCKVVVMLIDNATGRVINSDVAHFGQSGIAGIEADASEALYYDLMGLPVRIPEKGRIYIRVTGDKATKIIF